MRIRLREFERTTKSAHGRKASQLLSGLLQHIPALAEHSVSPWHLLFLHLSTKPRGSANSCCNMLIFFLPIIPFQYLAACARFCCTWDERCSRFTASCPVHHHCIVSIDHQSRCLSLFFSIPNFPFAPSRTHPVSFPPSLSPFPLKEGQISPYFPHALRASSCNRILPSCRHELCKR